MLSTLAIKAAARAKLNVHRPSGSSRTDAAASDARFLFQELLSARSNLREREPKVGRSRLRLILEACAGLSSRFRGGVLRHNVAEPAARALRTQSGLVGLSIAAS
jgi:hypothetical protein